MRPATRAIRRPPREVGAMIRLSPAELETLRVAARGKPLATWAREILLEVADAELGTRTGRAA